jgi:hypothetical protein
MSAMAPPNSALQRTVTHKVLGRGRPSLVVLCGRWRARVLIRHLAAAELGRYATNLHTKIKIAGPCQSQLNLAPRQVRCM